MMKLIEEHEMIRRGADLTDEDIERLADDAIEMRQWCFVNRVTKPGEMRRQVVRTMMRRLGRLGLMLAVLPFLGGQGDARDVEGVPSYTGPALRPIVLEAVGDCAPREVAAVAQEARILMVLIANGEPQEGIWTINGNWFITSLVGPEMCLTSAGDSMTIHIGTE